MLLYVGLLVIKDLKTVRNFIWAAYTKWYHLGVELELNPSDLEAIRTKFNNDPAECFNQVLLDWLMGQGCSCTWKNLATALKAPLIKFSSLSEAIEKKYCETGQTGNSMQLAQIRHITIKIHLTNA